MATVANSLAVRPSGGARTWTVVGEGYQTVIPVEDWLEAHRYLWSPNTVRGYATSLAHWWTFLETPSSTYGSRTEWKRTVPLSSGLRTLGEWPWPPDPVTLIRSADGLPINFEEPD